MIIRAVTLSLVRGLEELVRRVEGAGADPGRFSVTIHGDSKLVLKQVFGTWRCKAENLRPYRDRARELGAKFHHVVVERLPRDEFVYRFGH